MPKPVLHLQPIAGLCNRLRALISGICWAEELGYDLVVHWCATDLACHASMAALLDTRSLPSFVSVVTTELYYATQVLSPDDMDKALQQWKDKEKPLRIQSYGIFYNRDRARWLQHLRALRPKPELSAETQRRLRHVSHGARVGVHIRRGDNEKSIRDSPTPLFIRRMIECPAHSIFLVATDDEKVKSELLDVFPGRCVFPAEFRSRRSEHGMEEAMIDFIALSTCPLILGSAHSSFSEIAALYGGSELYVVKRDTV